MGLEERKTYVLVHGGFHGGWCWKTVATNLRKLGHEVYTPTLTGLGERSHLIGVRPTFETFIQDIVQVINFEELSDVILVGHSFAGPTISGVADRVPEKIRHIVFLDALVLRSGEAAADRSPPERMVEYRKRAAEETGGFGVPPLPPEYYGILDEKVAMWLSAKLTPQPIESFVDPLVLRHPLGNHLPVTYIASTNPSHPTTIKSREIARGMPDWNYLEIQTSHSSMITAPEELTAMLDHIL